MGKIAAALIALAAALSGCNSAPDSEEFVGTWHRVKYPKETLTVSREPDGTLAFVTHDYTSGQPQVGKLLGDQVVIDANTTATLRANGNLVYAGREYIK